jgi:hypothetical protein
MKMKRLAPAALFFLCLLSHSECDSEQSADCWVGVWVNDDTTEGQWCTECAGHTYYVLNEDGTYNRLAILVCEWSDYLIADVSGISDGAYEVLENEFTNVTYDATAALTCSGDKMSISDLSLIQGGGDWTKVTGDEAGAVKGLLEGKCKSPFTACYGQDGPANQCEESGDCVQPPSSTVTPDCTENQCLLYCS